MGHRMVRQRPPKPLDTVRFCGDLPDQLGYDMDVALGFEPDRGRFDSYYPYQYFLLRERRHGGNRIAVNDD